jgi:hypothetical protein
VTLLFGRVARMTFWRQPAPATFIGANPQFFDRIDNGIEITALRFKFSVDKHIGPEPNTCDITLFNANDETRSFIDHKPMMVKLDAGYDGIYRNLFIGNIRYSDSIRKGTEWETTMQVADGARAFSFGRMNRSYKKPISVLRVLQDAANSMSLQLPPEVEQSVELKQALSTGISMHGPARDILTRLLAPYGYSWSIQNQRLQILRDDQVREDQAVLINQGTGLVGTPARSTPTNDGKPSTVSCVVLLYPELTPGAKMKLQSQKINGEFRMQKIVSEGDTHDDGETWTSKIEARPLGPA